MNILKKIILFSLLACVLGLASVSEVQAQERGHKKARVSPNASVSQTIGTTNISITYGRPGVKGRKIFGELVPYGHWWRTGANESTVITFPKDVTIEGKSLKAGTYSLYTMPGKEEWTIIFNSKLSWGTQYDESKDVLRVNVKPKTAPKVDQLLFYFKDVTKNSAKVVLRWDKTEVPFSIKI